jgi:hypothetical protein
MTIAIAGENLDASRAQKLAMDLMEVIKAHYMEGPMERARVLEVLNALALCTAITVHGTDESEFATHVFSAAFEMNLDLYQEKFPNPTQEQS